MPLLICGTKPTDVVPVEPYVEELEHWTRHWKTLVVVWGLTCQREVGTLDPVLLKVHVAPAPRVAQDHGASALTVAQVEGPRIPGQLVPPPPEYLPDMKDTIAITNRIHALSPMNVAVHGPTGIGKSAVFPLAVAHWAFVTPRLKPGLTVCAQPRWILAKTPLRARVGEQEDA